jgi:hypothetical protein
MDRRIDLHVRQPPRLPQIFVERDPKDQRVSRPVAQSIVGAHLEVTAIGLRTAGRMCIAASVSGTSMARISLCAGAGVATRSSEAGSILPWGFRSFSINLFFFNTKTRQPVGFQWTDIAD